MKRLIVIAITALLILSIGCTINTETDLSPTPKPAAISGSLESPEPTVIPESKFIFEYNLVGKSLDETISILADSKLEYDVVEEYNENADTGLIISQSIATGTEIEEDTKIVLTISKGSEYVSVPNIVAMTKEEAIEFIENKLLTYAIIEIYSESIKENIIISQDIEPGTMIKIGDTVTVSSSLGIKEVQMVDLLNHTEAYVNAFFSEAILESEISYMQSNTVEAGKVISQSIASEEYVNEGTTIYIVISEGLVEFVLENYIGMPLSEVAAILSGKCILETRLEYNHEYNDRDVISQSIAAGNIVNVDSRITITVNNWDDKPVSFADAGLEQLIRGKINKSSGTLTYNDVKDIANLNNYDITHDKIRSLEGIENLKSLKSLYLFGENLTDVTPLAGLTELMSLNIECNNIQDISSLYGLVNMQNFSLSSNPISDISIMANMPDLEGVSLSGCPINSIRVLSEYTNIDFLNISNTYVPADEVRDIVTNYTNLRALHMTDIDVGSLDFLTCNNTLKFLSADFCGLENIETLTNFPYLKSLRIYHNEFEDISPLQNLNYLETLFIGFNPIQDISALENLTNISYLFITDIKATDFSVLANLTNLEKLYISMNIIDNVEFLKPLTRLEVLELNSDIMDRTNYIEVINEHKVRGCIVSEK